MHFTTYTSTTSNTFCEVLAYRGNEVLNKFINTHTSYQYISKLNGCVYFSLSCHIT